MKKTIIYTLIALTIVVVVGFVALFLINPGSPQDNQGQDQGVFGSLFPFGNGGNGDGDTRIISDDNDLITTDKPAPRLREVSASQVSGGYIYEKDGVVMIRFIDRATGHVYETEAESTTVTRVTNTTIPGIQEVVWVNENEFIIRYLNNETIEGFFVTLDPEAEGEQSLTSNFIEPYERGSIDELGESFFVVQEDSNGSELVLSEPSGENERSIFTSPISSWVPLQSNTDLFVYTAPASGVLGSLYKLTNETLTKVGPSLPGLTAKVSADNEYALIGLGEFENIQTLFVDLSTGESTELAVATLPAKCVFLKAGVGNLYCASPQVVPGGNYPDDWMLGSVSFVDDIWFVEPLERTATFVVSGDEVGEEFDVWQPMISPTDSHLIFMNKRDLSLWSLRLTEDGN